MDTHFAGISTDMTTTRATCWSVTINNPTSADDEEIALARQKGWKVEGQKEVGKEGTPHYQLRLQTPQVRFSQVKKAFSRGHIEIARNAAALANYVAKEETRVGQIPEAQDKYPSLSKFWDLVFGILNDGPARAVLESGGWRSDKAALATLDDAVGVLIRRGYHVETLGVNPQIRSSFTKYHVALFMRTIYSQTVRQTDNAFIPTEDLSGQLTQPDARPSQVDKTDFVPQADDGRTPPGAPPSDAPTLQGVQPAGVGYTF